MSVKNRTSFSEWIRMLGKKVRPRQIPTLVGDSQIECCYLTVQCCNKNMKIAQNIFHVMKCAINLDERQKASWVTHKLVEMNCIRRTASIEWVTNPGADSCSLPLPAISLTQTILQLLIQKWNTFRGMNWSVEYICLIILLAVDVEFVKCFTPARFPKLSMLPPK